ncbi:MAG: hypothetical protein JNK82_11680 [Myxococcaceae bacterium]|nr:hypothetical protein [Myxococcaceae bacterium]
MRRAIAIVALFVGSCSGSTKPCDPSTCMGCCDEAGECLAGTNLFECGAGGGRCVACAANELCGGGACLLFDGGYDAAFPMDPDGNYNLDAGVYDASRPDASVADAGRDGGVDAGRVDAGIDAGRVDAGVDAGRVDAGFDAGVDAGRDAGVDAGSDAGADDGGDGG